MPLKMPLFNEAFTKLKGRYDNKPPKLLSEAVGWSIYFGKFLGLLTWQSTVFSIRDSLSVIHLTEAFELPSPAFNQSKM